jgi:hypothetical protein
MSERCGRTGMSTWREGLHGSVSGG